MDDYFNKSFSEASRKFFQVLEIDPEDRTAKIFLEKTGRHIDAGIPGKLDGC